MNDAHITYTVSRVVEAARKQKTVIAGEISPLHTFTPEEVADAILFLETAASAAEKTPEPSHQVLLQTGVDLDNSAPRAANAHTDAKLSRSLHVSHAQRVAIIREARRMFGLGGPSAFGNFPATEIAGALVDLADILIATKEELGSIRPKTIEALSGAIRKLWPDLADEILRRWGEYRDADTQLLNQLLEKLRK